MFFNKDKSTAKKIATALVATLKTPFILTDHLTPNGRLHPPKGFYCDPYILGFCVGIANMSMTYDFNGANWDAMKRGNIIAETFGLLTSDDDEIDTMCQCVALYSFDPNAAPDYQRGTHDAETMYGAITGRLKSTDPDPILKQARSMARSMAEQKMFLGSSDQSILGTAISYLTIHEHIKDKFAAHLVMTATRKTSSA